jgi:hypothetical protein
MKYQHFATVGESEPTGDEKFFSLSRQPKCIPIIATQSISSLKSALPGESWRTLLQTFRTKIFLSLSDDLSARTASELCGREDRLKASYNLSESGHDAQVSLLTGKAMSHKASITASKSYSPHHDLRSGRMRPLGPRKKSNPSGAFISTWITAVQKLLPPLKTRASSRNPITCWAVHPENFKSYGRSKA